MDLIVQDKIKRKTVTKRGKKRKEKKQKREKSNQDNRGQEVVQQEENSPATIAII